MARTHQPLSALAVGGLSLAVVLSTGLALGIAPAAQAVEPSIGSAPAAPVRLRADDQVHPLNLDDAPQFGWLPQDADADEVQTAYEIEVEDEAGAPVWDSGKVASAEQAYVAYAGTALAPGSAYTWTVRTWDKDDQVSPWAADATFETGLGDGDWGGAQWIKRPPGNPDATGALSIVDGKVRVGGSASIPVTLAKTGTAWTDYTLDVDVTPRTASAGIMFRAPNTTSGYMLALVPGTGIRHHVQVAGAFPTGDRVTYPATIVIGTTYHLKVVVAGSSITYYLDGALKGTVTNTRWATGTIGFREASGESADFDNVVVTAPDNSVLFSDDFSGTLAKWNTTGSTAQESDEWTLARKQVSLPAGQVVRARSYVAGSQTYELWLNGKRADRGSSFTAPGEGYYQAADVTDLVTAGAPLAIGTVLHWYSGSQGRVTGAPGLLVRLVVDYADGSSYVVTSDGTWKVRRGPYLVGAARNGEGDFVEALDGTAVAAIGPWTTAGYDDSSWSAPVVIGTHPTAPFTHLSGQDSRMSETVVHPVKILTATDGTPVADFGTIIPARPGVHFEQGVAGRVISLRASYRLASDGRVATDGISTQSTDMRFPYTQVAGAQDFQAFTHLGFRYLEIPGADEDISVDDVTATVVHTDLPEDGAATFESSNDTLDAVFDLMQRSAKYSVQETFVDTPTREKGQFLADSVNISYALMNTLDERVHTRQAIEEFINSQNRYWTTGNDAGRYNAVYPNVDGKRDIPDFTELFPNWILRYYQETGDRELLEKAYPSILATAGYIRRAIPATGNTAGLVTNLPGGSGQYLYGIVDWPAPGRFGYDMTAAARTTVNALGVDVLRSVAAAGRVLGKPAPEVDALTADADALTTRMNQTLRLPDGTYVDGLLASGAQSTHAGQHATSYALAFGIAPEADRPALAEKIGALGMKQGPMTAHWLLRGLVAGGNDTDLLQLLTTTDDIGWAKTLADGGTFTTEEWVPDSAGNSLSHGWGTQSIVDITQSVLGIENTAPGGAQLAIGIPDTGLKHAAGSVMTQRGRVSSDWTLGTDTVNLSTTLPVNTTAVVSLPVLPAGQEYDVTGGAAAEELPGTADLVQYRVGSGTWTFASDVIDPAPKGTLATTVTSPTTDKAIPVTLVFDQAVTGLTADDIVVTNGTVSGLTGSGASYSFTVTATETEPVGISVPAGAVVNDDEVGNEAVAALSVNVTDPAPKGTLATTVTSPTTVKAIPVTLVFDQAVTGLTVDDIVVTNGTVSGLTGSGASYSFTVTATETELVRISVPAGAVVNDDEVGNEAVAALSVNVTDPAPKGTLATTVTSPTTQRSIPVTLVFDRAVTGLTADDIVVTNGTVSGLTGSGSSYSFTVTATQAGTVTVAVPAGAVVNEDDVASEAVAALQVRVTDPAPPVPPTPGPVATSTKVTVAKKPTTERPGRVKVSVTSAAGVPSGTVTVTITGPGKDVTRTVRLVRGKGGVAVPKLRAGTYRVTVRYAGADGFRSSTKTVTLKVKRR